MNDFVKIATLFECGRAVRPRGNVEYFESACNWVFIIYNGSVRYADENRNEDLTKNRLYILPAGKNFSLRNPPQGGPDHFYALVSCVPPIREFVSVNLTDAEFISDVAKLIEKYNAKNDRTSVTSLLETALGYALTKLCENDTVAARVKKFIDETSPKFSMQTLCEKFHYSRRYLDMKFKETYGVTVDKYGDEKKFEFILSEIMKKVPLETICSEADYSSAANLSRDFKKRFGMPPLTYRRFLEKQKQ